MLTEEAIYERMWGQFPTLGKILATKTIPDHYFGLSSISDNEFNRVQRLMRISILLRENCNEIKNEIEMQLHDRAGDRLREELHRVAIVLEETAQRFRARSLDITDGFELPTVDLHRPGDPPTSKTYDRALFRAALVLAWYGETHGTPPQNDSWR
jgi:hypothetical protein